MRPSAACQASRLGHHGRLSSLQHILYSVDNRRWEHRKQAQDSAPLAASPELLFVCNRDLHHHVLRQNSQGLRAAKSVFG